MADGVGVCPVHALVFNILLMKNSANSSASPLSCYLLVMDVQVCDSKMID